MGDKWVPESFGGIDVSRVEAVPADCRVKGDGPIILGVTMLKVFLANGKIRYFGVKNAFIDSYLRMRVTLLDDRDEVRNKWEDAKE